MFTSRVLEKMLNAALHFAVCGAFWCALWFGIQCLVAALIWFGADIDRVTTDTIRKGDFRFGTVITLFPMLFTAFGASCGFIGGGGIFLIAGLIRGAQPDDDCSSSFRRSLKAARHAAVICGWGAALTGVTVVMMLNYFSSNAVFPNRVAVGFGYGLFIGNALGCALGAFSLGTVERVRELISTICLFRH
jgi:hypothetical protein